MIHPIADPGDIEALGWETNNSVVERESSFKITELPSIFSFGEKSIEWAVQDLIAMSAVTMISGDPGLLKTTLATSMARAISDGVAFAGVPTTKREVLQLDRENSLPVTRERFCRLGIVDGGGFRIFGGWHGDVPAADSPSVLEYVAATNPKPLIIEDSLIASIDGNENDAAVIRAYMRRHRKLAEMGCGVIILHHSGKADTARKYRGSSDIHAAVDVAYSVQGVGDPTRLDGIHLKVFKSRFGTRQIIGLRFDGHSFGAEVAGPTFKTVPEQLKELLRANPGINTTEFQKLAAEKGLSRDRARDFLRNGIGKCISITRGKNNSRFHTWVDVNPAGA